MISGITTGIDKVGVDAGRAPGGRTGQTHCQKHALPTRAYNHENVQNRNDLWATPLPPEICTLDCSRLRRK
jgi:hypothetical protein